ncbi:MAG: phosphotransferase family protein [Burkholderiales bacterium]
MAIATPLRSESESIPQDWDGLAAHLSSQGFKLELDPRPSQFSGGLANLNYLLKVDGRDAVLRRPPMGPLPPGAYDMGREFRILSALSKGFDLAPAAIYLGEDTSVIGAPFQILEYRRGFAVRSELPDEFRGKPEMAKRLGETVIDVLVRVANIDPQAVGLGELGRPEGFLKRTVEGWSKRAVLAAEGGESPLIREISAWLHKHLVPDGKTTLLHNDIKLDNILLDERNLNPVALLDWDQCTRGDGLFDLATTLSYWTEASDPPGMQALRQMPTGAPGFWTRREAAEVFAKRSGRDLSDFRFYRVLASFKLAVIFYQLHARYRSGATTDPRYAEFGSLADDILEFTWSIARGDIF